MVALAACSTASGIVEVGLIALIAQIATTAAKGHANHAKLGLVHLNASPKTLFIAAFILAIARALLQLPLALLPARISAGVQSRLRRELFGVFTRASWEKQSADREGHLQEILTGQVSQATGAAMQATALVISAFSFVVLMISAVLFNWVAALVILAAAALLFGMLRPLNVIAVRLARELSRAQLEYAGGISEAGRVAEETHVFGAGEAQRKRVGALIDTAQALFYRSTFVNRLSPSLYQSAIFLILVGGLAALYYAGPGHFASLGAVVLLIIRAGSFGQQVQGSYQGLRTSLPYVDRLQGAARRYEDSIPPDGHVSLPQVASIAFEDVSFGYRPGRPVLKRISFEVPTGEAVGIIGPSGAGKSTLIQILLQLRLADEGRYLVNGVPVQDFVRADWYRRVSYVPQQPRLLHATVAENIRFLRALDDEAVERAGRLARIHDEIMSWPEGYQTIVGPRMDAVSGGQQQRICLARALAARPEVLVLDEPTSALDPHSERLIQDSLSGLRHDMTLFIIAHRLSTLDICDRVMVIDNGSLAAFDTTELLQQNSSYYRSASLLATAAPGGQLP
jgi:ABC-type multidrug transport system fused ATPase/permease subunit